MRSCRGLDGRIAPTPPSLAPGPPSNRYRRIMGNSAAFFDMDRTLLRGASGPLLNEALASAGLVPSRGLPGQSLFYRFYDLVGDSLPGMALARAAALAMRGRSRQALQAAAEEVAEKLETLVAPYAPIL